MSSDFKDRIAKAKSVCRAKLDERRQALKDEAVREINQMNKYVDKVVKRIEVGAVLGQTLYKFKDFSKSDFLYETGCCWTQGLRTCQVDKNTLTYKVIEWLEALKLDVRPMMETTVDKDLGLMTEFYLEIKL